MAAFALIERGKRRDHLFYADEADLRAEVVSHLLSAVAAGGAGAAFVSSAHERALRHSMEQAATAEQLERILFAPAEEILSRLRVDGRFEKARFFEIVGSLLDKVSVEGAPLHVYGEMSGYLWEREELSAVAELEGLWLELAAARPFYLLTGYLPLDEGVPRRFNAFEQVLGLHASLLEEKGVPSGAKALRARSRRFPPEATSPAKVRAFTRETLESWGVARLDDALLVASELSTNAVVHAASDFWVVLARLEDGIRVSVRDQTAFSDERDPEVDGVHGLGIVSRLSRSWGIERHDRGKTVWSELAVGGAGP